MIQEQIEMKGHCWVQQLHGVTSLALHKLDPVTAASKEQRSAVEYPAMW